MALAGLAVLGMLLAGCPAGNGSRQSGSLVPPAGTVLRLAVADDPQLADAIDLLRAEWQAQAGFAFEVEPISLEQLLRLQQPLPDWVICPSAYVGVLAQREHIQPVPADFISSEQAGWADVFSLLRVGELSWNGKPMALPLGSPVLTLYYRADLFEKLGFTPPSTWSQYQQLVEKLSDRSVLGELAPADDVPWSATREPLANGWAGIMLLARAAAYVSHRDSLSKLFDIETMEPLVDRPPFVRALEELVAAVEGNPEPMLTGDPHAVRSDFWLGRCAMAVTWPSAAAELPDAIAPHVKAGFAELPGSPDVYNMGAGQWEQRRADEDVHVPLLGSSGRAMAVGRDCRWPAAAFQLAFWLSSEQVQNVAAASRATTLYRRSQVRKASNWVERPAADAAVAYAEATEQSLNRLVALPALRIPGREEYLAALDRAVNQAVTGHQSPQEALRQAAQQWNEITDRLDRGKQRQAYRSEVGIP